MREAQLESKECRPQSIFLDNYVNDVRGIQIQRNYIKAQKFETYIQTRILSVSASLPKKVVHWYGDYLWSKRKVSLEMTEMCCTCIYLETPCQRDHTETSKASIFGIFHEVLGKRFLKLFNLLLTTDFAAFLQF